ncbi:MAG: hypothetical protein LBI33_11710 [Propionibacteriaceae bacterium]|jgi:hypothetical protein|nr:hypothetical protein [Propionibacteriaceae bacterium]
MARTTTGLTSNLRRTARTGGLIGLALALVGGALTVALYFSPLAVALSSWWPWVSMVVFPVLTDGFLLVGAVLVAYWIIVAIWTRARAGHVRPR